MRRSLSFSSKYPDYQLWLKKLFSLRGVKGIKRVFLMEQDETTVSREGSIVSGQEKEWVLETDGVNLKIVMCIDGVGFILTTVLKLSMSCVLCNHEGTAWGLNYRVRWFLGLHTKRNTKKYHTYQCS